MILSSLPLLTLVISEHLKNGALPVVGYDWGDPVGARWSLAFLCHRWSGALAQSSPAATGSPYLASTQRELPKECFLFKLMRICKQRKSREEKQAIPLHPEELSRVLFSSLLFYLNDP